MLKTKIFLLTFIIFCFSIFFINQQSYAQAPNKIILSNDWVLPLHLTIMAYT